MMIEVVALEQKIKPKVRKECALFVLLKMMMSMFGPMLRELEEINQNIS